MLAQAISRSVQVFGQKPALILGDRAHSWSEVGEKVSRIAGAMTSMGLKQGDHVALLAGNTPDHVMVTFAIFWAGLVLIPLNTRLSAAEMAHIVDEAQAAVLFSDRANREGANAVLKNAPQSLLSVAMDSGAAGSVSLADISQATPMQAAAAHVNDLAALYYTGGTTGSPKGVMITDGALLVQALCLMNELGISSDSRVMHAPPLFHLAGAGVCQSSAFAGAVQIFLAQSTPEALVKAVGEQRPTHVNMVPTIMSSVAELVGAAEAFRGVRRIIYGAAPITEGLLRKVLAICPDVELTQIYGQTECTGPCLVLPPERHVLTGPNSGKLTSAGRASATSEVRIIDSRGEPVPAGAPGEILVRSPAVMQGYWRKPEETKAALAGGWLHTGDVGIIDDDGFVRIVDRVKDMIVTGGENVFCAEVENVISSHPSVSFCSVIGLPDEHWGERVHAVVGLNEATQLHEEELIAYCYQFIARYKCPKTIDITDVPLPVSAVGKVQKNLLRARYLTSTETLL